MKTNMFTNEELLEIKRMMNFCIWKDDFKLGIPYDKFLDIREKINEYIGEKEES